MWFVSVPLGDKAKMLKGGASASHPQDCPGGCLAGKRGGPTHEVDKVNRVLSRGIRVPQLID